MEGPPLLRDRPRPAPREPPRPPRPLPRPPEVVWWRSRLGDGAGMTMSWGTLRVDRRIIADILRCVVWVIVFFRCPCRVSVFSFWFCVRYLLFCLCVPRFEFWFRV